MSDTKGQLAELTQEQRQELLARLALQKKKQRPKRYALSFAQQRLWVLDQMEGETAAYIVPTALRLEGPLDVGVLERCFGEVMRRHDSLRTTFETDQVTGAPEQLVNPWTPFRLETIDLSDIPEEQRFARARALANEEAHAAFNLRTGPLLRASLLKLADDDHILLLTIHHIVSDMWSTQILTREVTLLYQAFSRGEESPLPELPIQFADFAHWQRNRMQGDVLEKQLVYWRKQLNGRLPVLELPTRGTRPSRHTLNGAEKRWRLNLSLTEKLRVLSRSENATLFMVLLAAFKVLLLRYTGQQDMLVGTPIANRNRREVEGLIGLFINTLVLRTDLSGDPGFRELLGRVREVALDGYANQDVPFEKLVQELQPERDLSRTPLFQVMFALQNVPQQKVQAFDLTISPFELEVRTSKFDLTLTTLEDEQGLLGVWEYNTDLFDGSMIERMIRHFETLLEQIVADPDRRLSRLPMLTEAERLKMIPSFEETPAHSFTGNSLHELFESQVGRAPAAVALTCEGQEITYEELNRRANKLAHYLRSRGVGAESLVGICVERSLEMVVGLLGILKAGGAYVPLDPTYPRDRLAFVLDDAGIRVLLTQSQMMESLPRQAAEVICLDDDSEKLQAESEENPPSEVVKDNAAYVIYTSGSTGQPKGVVVTHGHVIRLFAATQSWFNFGAEDVWTLFHSYAFDFSVWELWGALLYGGRLVIVPYIVSRSPEAFYETLIAEKVTVLNQTPSAFRQLMQVDEQAGAARTLSLRTVIFGGEALDIAGLKSWFARHGDRRPQLVNMYGITETTVHVTYRPLVKEDAVNSASLIGVPIPDLQLYILDRHLQPVPFDVAGEIFVGGAGVARVYLNRPELTAERFISDPFGERPGRRLYRTGDSARRLSNGDIEYLGRIDQQVKIRGFRIELGEIEAALLDLPQIRDAVVIAGGSGQDDKQLRAYIVLDELPAPSIIELRNSLKKKLPDYMLPAHFVMLDALPLTPNGKLDRRALPEPQEDVRPDLGAEFVEPRTSLEQALAETWSEVLQIKTVGIDDNFFELGGDSILSIQMLSRAQRKGLNFPIQQLFEHQTIRGLAHALDTREASVEQAASEPFGALSDEDRRRLPDGLEDAYPLTMLQAGMLFHSNLDPGAAVYHNVGSYHLRAPLSVEKMRRAVELLVSRHPVLRTSFDLVTFSEPMQLVHGGVPVPLEVEDLRALSAAQQEQAIKDWIESEKHKQFDWTSPPLLRFHVHRRSDDTFQLSMTEHHAILDGWSVASALTELFQTYFSLLNNNPDLVEPPRSGSFRDFVILERAALASEECRGYWREKLSESAAAILPRWPASDPPADAPSNHVIDVPISVEVSDALKQLARSQQIPLKNVLLAAHLRIMSLLSGQPDVVTGVVTHGRPEGREGERALGLFLNTVPFRQALRGGTWAELAKQTFETEREFMPYRYYQMAQIQRDQGGQPLFETVFNFTNFHVFQNLAELGDLEVLDASLFAQTNLTFWANFSMGASSPAVQLTLNAEASQLRREQMEAIGGYYARALEEMACNPRHDYAHCDLLSERERNQLLFEWNDTGEDYPQADCINQLFETQVERTPDSVAVVSGSERLTYRQLNQRANQLARRLRLLGVEAETRIGICLERSTDLVVALMGVLKAGGAYVPLDPAYPQERSDFMLDDAQASILITQQSLADKLRAPDRKLVCFDSEREQIGRLDTDNLASIVSQRNLAYVIYTSGSTGKPKGVSIEHRNALAFLHWARKVFFAHEFENVLASTSVCFDLSVFEIFGSLSWGAKVILVEDALHLSGVPEDENVRLINTVPSAMAELVRLGAVPESVRTVNLAGEALHNRLAQQAYQQGKVDRVFNLYGPSEDTTYSTYTLVERGAEGEPTIGRPISNTQTFVLDERLRPSPIGVAGELHIGGGGLARGYLNRPELNAEKFIPDPFSTEPGARLYKTGDLARYLSDGNLEYLGRIDHQVKIRGFRIELGEVETVLSKQAGVREAVVLDCGPSDDKRMVAYVVLDTESPLTAEQLRKGLREKLPDYMVPSSFVFLDAVPLTPNRKIDRRALRQLETAAHQTERQIVAPRDLLEFQLVRIWENIFNTSPISITDNFFDLGGHSLLAVRLVAQVRDRLKQTIPLSSLVQGASVESLASLLRQQTDLTPESPAVAIQPAGFKTPFFCIHPIGGNILCYMELARSMGSERPFYGIQASGSGGNGELETRIENMASHYIEAVRTIQPEGPYLLGGWSFGGVVAFEMARQLKQRDGQVAHVTMLDTWAPPSQETPGQYEPDSAEMLSRFLTDFAGISGKSLEVDCDYLRQLDAPEQLRFILNEAIKLNLLPPDMEISQFASLFEVFERNGRAFLAYAPPPLEPGTRIMLFRASEGKEEARDGLTLGWERISADRLEVRHVEGDHYTTLTGSHARTLAEQLKSWLDAIAG
ncbi:MAG: amino acid adenylation domain-containing protein [Acidobacteria bacterium]|nr:amino acid adenylation domain-containing protein [Acidobacteriota bacterium]